MIRQEPTNYEGYFWRGFLELQGENGYDAVRFFRRAEALDANPYVLKLLAVAYYTVRQFRLFTLKMDEAMRKQPEDFAPYYYLGRYYVTNEVTDWDRSLLNTSKRQSNAIPSIFTPITTSATATRLNVN